ncbi:Prenyltransferase and squalene oxidase repeat [Nakaseomyces glabratus]
MQNMPDQIKKKHVKYIERHLQLLPAKYEDNDVNKMAILYYSFQSLSLLGEDIQGKYSKYIPWIKSHLITKSAPKQNQGISGFVGSLNVRVDGVITFNLPNTLFALLVLALLKQHHYICHEMDGESIGRFVGLCQLPNGSFKSALDLSGTSVSPVDGEDLRFCYIAVALLYIIGCRSPADYSKYINVSKLLDYIKNQQCFDGAYGQYGEAHAGYTSCALSTLALLKARETIDEKFVEKTLTWLSHRQVSSSDIMRKQEEQNPFYDTDDHGGFQGRPNKFADTCYATWCLNSIQLLTKEWQGYVDQRSLENYLLNVTQNQIIGGFSKNDADDPDLYHTCLGISALILLDERLDGSLFLPAHISKLFLK